jgi:hypothetical protein
VGTAFQRGQGQVTVRLDDKELVYWRRILPAMVERARVSGWREGVRSRGHVRVSEKNSELPGGAKGYDHVDTCEYRKKIPVSVEYGESPVCGCGRGKMMTKEMVASVGGPSCSKYFYRAALGSHRSGSFGYRGAQVSGASPSSPNPPCLFLDSFPSCLWSLPNPPCLFYPLMTLPPSPTPSFKKLTQAPARLLWNGCPGPNFYNHCPPGPSLLHNHHYHCPAGPDFFLRFPVPRVPAKKMFEVPKDGGQIEKMWEVFGRVLL